VRVLVTGVSGFTGSCLARFLEAEGDQVRGLARRPEEARTLVGPGVDVVGGDLTDVASLERAMVGVEVVFNIAALFRDAGPSRAEFHAVNAEAVATIVRVAKAAGVRRVVHCSTVGVHGDIEQPPANEDAPFKPGDVYQETKLEGELLGRKAAEAVELDLVIVRPTGIYGPGDRRLLKLFGRIASGRFVMLGGGRNFYHLTYVEDLCRGFRLCATVPAAAGRTYILAGDEVTTLAELVALTAEAAGVSGPRLRLPVWPVWLVGAMCEAVFVPLGISPPIYRRRVDFFRKSRSFDNRRARTELGFAPAVSVRDGIARTLEYYRDQGWI